MKRVIFLLGLCLCVGFVAIAQDVEEDFNAAYANKRGVYLLPQAGSFAIGIDARPFLEYLGSFFSDVNLPPSFGDQTIYGKYFLEDNRAIRGRLTLNMYNDVSKGQVSDDTKSNPDEYLIDIQRYSLADITLGAGYEFRRGYGRVQGFYGGEFMLGYRGGKSKYEYGNKFTIDNTTPTTYDFDYGYAYNVPVRPVEDKFGKRFSVGVGAFAGVEYFFAPQMSVGGELNVNLWLRATGQGQLTSEKWNATIDDRDTQISKSGNWNAFRLGFDSYPSGRIFLMFHF